MSEKGLLTKAMQAEISNWLDEKIKLNGIFETIDGLTIKLVIAQLDDSYGEKINEPYKSAIKEVIKNVFEEKDYEKAIKTSLDFVNQLVDIPYLDDESERLLFEGLLSILLSILAKLTPKEE